MAVPDFLLKEVKSCKVRNMNMIEELGEIEYLFCDKTGTLTQNELEFKAISIATREGITVSGSIPQIRENLLSLKGDELTDRFFDCLNLCHETIAIESKHRKGQTDYTGPSVDENCFLETTRVVRDFGFFLGRDSQSIEL